MVEQVEETDVASAEESPSVVEDESNDGGIPVAPIVTVTVLLIAALTGLLLPKKTKLFIGEMFRQIFKTR